MGLTLKTALAQKPKAYKLDWPENWLCTHASVQTAVIGKLKGLPKIYCYIITHH